MLDPVGAGIDDFTNTVERDRRPGQRPRSRHPADNTDSDTDTLDAAPDYTITKDDALATAQPGDTITYTITVDNAGNQDGTGVVVNDSFPTNVLTNVTASNGGVVDPLLGTINWNLGALAASGSVTLTVTADVLDPVGAGINDFTNTVSVTDDLANGPDPTPADNTGSDTDTLDAAPDLQLTIDDGGISTTPDGTVVYTLDYTNVGDQDATGVVITQTLPANTTFDPANSTPGWVDQGGGSYTLNVGDLDVGQTGSVFFAVKVNGSLPPGYDQLVAPADIADDGSNGLDQNPADNSDTRHHSHRGRPRSADQQDGRRPDKYGRWHRGLHAELRKRRHAGRHGCGDQRRRAQRHDLRRGQQHAGLDLPGRHDLHVGGGQPGGGPDGHGGLCSPGRQRTRRRAG